MDLKKIAVVFATIFLQVSIQMELAELLSMKRRPIDRTKVQIPEELFRLYDKQMNQEYDTTALPLPGRLTRSANTVRSYTHQESSIDFRFRHNHTFRLSFDLMDFPANEDVTSCELKLTLVPDQNGSLQRVSVYDILKPGIKGESQPVLRIVDTTLVNTSDATGVVSLDTLPATERWLSDPKGNYGLLVQIRSPTGNKVASSPLRLKRSLEDDDDARWEAEQPLLLVYSMDAKARRMVGSANWGDLERRKRSGGGRTHSNKKRGREECRRHQMWVDFEKVGWNDWIVAPPGYDAYYCAGDCPFPLADHLNTTNHAIIQTLVHTVYPLAISQACCLPTSLTSISMLYLDEQNKAVLKNYPDMVVEGCGCR